MSYTESRIQKLHKKIERMNGEIEEIKEERDDLLYEVYGKEYYNNYLGKYNKEHKFLVINHGCGEDSPMYTSEYAPCIQDGYYSIKGSWDNWTGSYPIHKTLACNDEYKGYVHYINLDIELENGKQYEYKYMDEDVWIEVKDNWLKDEYIDNKLNQKMIRNTFGTWNACLTVKIT